MSSENIKTAPPKPPPADRKRLRDEGWSMAWVKPALRSRRTLKTWLRCCIAVLVTLVLMVATKPSLTMGAASFFAVIVAIMLPPSFAFSVFILAVLMLLVGMLIGWAWGNAAVAAAHSVRSFSLLVQQQQKLQSSLDPNIPVALQTQLAVLHGLFLDPRSSAVYGAFLFIGSFALGALRAYVPNLALLSIFGSIVIAVVCTSGPLFPTAQYMIPKSFILPACFYVGVAIACIALIFPESLSHVWLTSLYDDFWTPTLDLLRLQSEALKSIPSDHESWAEIHARGFELRAMLIDGAESLCSQIGLIDLDMSIGRLGPADMKKIGAELKSMMFRASGLHSFPTFVNDMNKLDEKERLVTEATTRGDATPRTAHRYQVLQRRIREREIQHGHGLDSLIPILGSSSENLRNACESGVECIVEWFRDCNGRRWAGFFSRPNKTQIEEHHDSLVDHLRLLEDALDDFRNVQRVNLVKPFESFFDPETKKLVKRADMFASRSLYICFVFIDTLDAFAERLIKFLKVIIEIDVQRPKTRFWFPGRIAKENITSSQFKGTSGPFSMGTTEDPTTFKTQNSKNSSQSALDEDDEDRDAVEKEPEHTAEPPAKRNPDAFPPKTPFGRAFVKLAAFLRFLKSAEGILALRVGIVSVALWVPAVCASSAWFYFEHKGLWALIMAQTALALYAGDQIASFVERLVGTILGLLIGMAVWYMGAGRGNGNPYALVIVSTVFLSPFLFARIAAPPAQLTLWTMIAVTVVFVVGYSWVNANHFVLGNPGVGIALGWKRALLVIVGFTAAFIVMLFPTPISSRVLVRKTLAATINETGSIFAGEVEAFLGEESRAQSGEQDEKPPPPPPPVRQGTEVDDEKVSPKERRVRKIGKRVLAVATRMKELEPSLTTAKFEPQLSGTWPHAQYQELFNLQSRILGSLVLLITSFAKLNSKWCSSLVHRTPFMNPNFLSDIFTTITIISDALMNGHPLPAYLPNLRDRLVYHEHHVSKRMLHPSVNQPQALSDFDENKKDERTIHNSNASSEEVLKRVSTNEDEEIGNAAAPSKVDGSSMGLEADELTLDVLMDEQLPAHSTAIVAFSSLISRIDEMTEIVRTLCGEATFRGYDSLQRFYLDREERAVGGGLIRGH